MIPLIHILVTLPFCFILYNYFDVSLINTLIIFFSAWIFDIDHYLWCIFHNKSFSLKKCYEYHSPHPRKDRDLLHIFHTIEFHILILALSFFSEIFLCVIIGIAYHMLFDLVNAIYMKQVKGVTEVWNMRAISLIMWLKRHYSPSKSTKLKTL
ncbi:MAG: hypothetical protein WC413_00455 [Candidatus Nanoarchaeia archaeon]